jgi:limonene-1,2-epoxide hydrolase
VDADRIIRDFADAWGRGDVDAIVDAFADDAVYHNMPMAPLRGKDEIRAFLVGFLGGNGIHFEIHHQLVAGNVVMNERTDTITMGDRTIPLPVCGIFELADDGRIAAWRDYFDIAVFTAQS